MRGLNLLICLLVVSYLPGQELIRLEENWTEYEISTREGLSSNVIQTIIQDGTGTFWFGEQNTVDRIDLTAERPFSYSQNGGLSGYGFRTFAIARDSFLFVGNTANVYKINIHSPNAKFKSLELDSTGGINSLAIQGDSLLWIAGENGLERRSINETGSEYYLPLTHVHKLSSAGDALYLLNHDTLQFFPPGNYDPTVDSLKISSIGTEPCKDFLVQDNMILWTDGFSVYLECDTIINRLEKAGEINKLVIDEGRNQLLLCTTEGLVIWEKKEGIYRQIMHKFRKNNILTAYVDAAGNLWVSQSQSGLIYVHRPKSDAGLEVLRLPDTLGWGANATWSLAVRGDYLYWGTIHGLFATRLGMPDSTIRIEGIDERVTVLRLQGDSLLIGTLEKEKGKGRLWRLNVTGDGLPIGNKPKEIKEFDAPVRALAFDRYGNLLVGLSDISPGDGEKTKSLYRRAVGSPTFQAVSGFLDRDAYTLEYIDDTMYVGTSRGEVLRLNQSLTLDTVWQYDNDPVLTITRIDTSLLVGTFYGGLHRVDDLLSTSILSDYTDLFNAVYSVAEDSKGNWWLSTDQGIHRFSHDMNTTMCSFDFRHGVQGIDFNKGAFCFDAQDGSLLFGGENGLNRVWPDRFSFQDSAYFTARVTTEATALEDWNNFAVEINVKDPIGTTPLGILYGFMSDRDSIIVTQIFKPDPNILGSKSDTIVQHLDSFQLMRPTRSGKYKLMVTRYQNGKIHELPFGNRDSEYMDFDYTFKRPWSVWFQANWLIFILPPLIGLLIFLYRKNQSVSENLEDTKESLTELKLLFGALIKAWRGSYDKLLLNFKDVLDGLDLGKEQVSIIWVQDNGKEGLLQQSYFLLRGNREIQTKLIPGEENFSAVCFRRAQKSLDTNRGIYPHEAIIVEGDVDNVYRDYGFEKKPVTTSEDQVRSVMFLPLVKKVDGQLECIGAINTQDATTNRYASKQVQAMIQVLAEQVGHNVIFRVTFSDILDELWTVRKTWESEYYSDTEPFHARGGWFDNLPPYYSALIKLFDPAEDAIQAWIEPLALRENKTYPDVHPLNVAVKSIIKSPGENSDLTITWIVFLLLGSRTASCDSTRQRLATYKKEFSDFEALLKSALNTPDRILIDTAIRDNPLLGITKEELKEVMNLLVRLFSLLSFDKFTKQPTDFKFKVDWDDNLPRLTCHWKFSSTGRLASLNRLYQRNAIRNNFGEVGKVSYDLMDYFGSNMNIIADEETDSLKLIFTPHLPIKSKG